MCWQEADDPTQMEGRYARRAVCCRKGFDDIIENLVNCWRGLNLLLHD